MTELSFNHLLRKLEEEQELEVLGGPNKKELAAALFPEGGKKPALLFHLRAQGGTEGHFSFYMEAIRALDPRDWIFMNGYIHGKHPGQEKAVMVKYRLRGKHRGSLRKTNNIGIYID